MLPSLEEHSFMLNVRYKVLQDMKMQIVHQNLTNVM